MTKSEPQYHVLVNAEGQFSLWPLHRPPAPGWSSTGVTGEREACLREVAGRWLDQRPQHLRDRG